MTIEIRPPTPSDSTSLPDVSPSLCYEDVIKEVIEPLPSHLIKVRPGAMTKDKKKAIVLPYYDWRIMVNRLDLCVGGRNWYAHLQPWGDHKLICTLTILGVSKDSSGEGEADDENGGTSAEQQAKKRAMAEHGLNYLYLLPKIWGEYDAEKKCFVNPQALVEEMYNKAHIEGLDLKPYISSLRKSSGGRASTLPVPSISTGVPTPAIASPSTELTTEKETSTPPVKHKILQGMMKEETEWFTSIAWRNLAEICNQFLKKGKKVYIEGRIAQRKYTDREGVQRTAVEVIASDMEMLTPKQQAAEEVDDDVDALLAELERQE